MDSIEITPTTLLIIGGISLFLGMLATLLLNSLREDVVPPEESADTPPGGKKGRYTPVARLWREKGSGRLVVEMDGRSLVNTDPLDDSQRDRLEKAERDFRAWLGMGIAASASPAAPTAIPAPASVSPTTADAAMPASAPPAQIAAQPASQPTRQDPPAVRTVPFTPPSVPPAVIPPAAPPVRSNRSIVEQIEDILQDMLIGSPLAARGIHLHQDPSRGVMVQVGMDYYEGIDSVPDPEIKSLLKSAVATWENSQ